MEDREKLEKWVREKLDEGYTEDRLRDVVGNRDLDPSVVDEVSSNGSTSQDNADASTNPDEEGGDEPSFRAFRDPNDTSTREEDTQKPSDALSSKENGGTAGEEGGQSPSSVTKLVEATPHIKWVASGLAVAAIAVAGIAVANVMDKSSSGTKASGAAEIPDGCSDVGDIGVRLGEVSRSVGSTTATVSVVRGQEWLALEVYRSGDLKSSSRKYVEDSAEMTVGAVGDRAVLHPVNCELYRDSVSYS